MLIDRDFPDRSVDLVMECVCSLMFSLMINRKLHAFFTSKGRLGQGDPLPSSLLFVMFMEYLARILVKMSKLDQFHFHPRCNSIKLTHLSFANDLILCSKGDYASLYLMF